MKALKYIGQILTALLHTPLYTGIMYFVIVFPTMWIITLSTWKMILAFILLGGIIEGVISLLQVLGLMPFAWIVKNNKFAFWLSIILCILLPLYNIVALWKILLGHGGWGIFAAIVLTLLFVQFIYVSVLGLMSLKVSDTGDTTESKNTSNEKISTAKKAALSNPKLRHRIAANTVGSSKDSGISICNKMMSVKVAPLLAEGINAGKIDISVLGSKKYYEDFLSHLFGQKSKEFMDKLRIDKLTIDKHPNVRVWILAMPSTGEIGQSEYIGFVYAPQKGVSAYTLEHSADKSKAICEWHDKTHYYYGNAETYIAFINQIVSLKTE